VCLSSVFDGVAPSLRTGPPVATPVDRKGFQRASHAHEVCTYYHLVVKGVRGQLFNREATRGLPLKRVQKPALHETRPSTHLHVPISTRSPRRGYDRRVRQNVHRSLSQ